jgi:hypothetical protein
MDIAVDLVEAYLRLTGYLTLSEFDVQARRSDGRFDTITDVDVMALRFPGDVFAADPHDASEARLLLIDDPVLLLEPDQIDIIVGEVKQGPAEFNPGIHRHEVLHSVMRRVAWLFDADTDSVVDDLGTKGVCVGAARGGGTIRVRLVAFGQAPSCDLRTISHAHMIETLLRLFSGLDDAFRSVHFHAPAPGMLNLVRKSGLDVIKNGSD